ncbi:hypothetical protein BDY17DRAFT_139088 [Neohortaea acidophila]|uniref:ATPase synthesis protein 25 n=1 Tax=Neohortaea acidophila TaxID=245834 RepID=A0A6A6PSA2_9PEZI|nr:uncharacterized protein BDY17DRAFT_139088 [Neohortaea acidophila]KAF2482979.1 hypothetical protein BDY17DRAFT_139088 [Neohortaea acidophila]
MALRGGLAKTLGCYGCQQWILRSFIAVAAPSAALTPSIRTSPPQRHFSRTRHLRNEHERSAEGGDEHPLNTINDATAAGPEAIPATPEKKQGTYVPWYLQVQQPLPPSQSPPAHRQKIPDLPPNPPELLNPLLQHVSVELGMDDLSLLDLRSLDPPPGLGANLLMIIGTARSEKHLHVSADRLCRWLRSEYKLTPYADGLLGRNELKLKLRRKAKRVRLMSAVGAQDTADTDVDDGIRTGWVCVNVGEVKGGQLPAKSQEALERPDIVGFGSRTEGSNVVVQLLTEEKRGEIDLERLWTDELERSEKRQQKLQASERKEAEALESGDSATPTQPANADNIQRRSSDVSADFASTSGPAQQLRAYHTSARRMSALAEASSSPAASDLPALSLQKHLSALKQLPSKRALEALGTNFMSEFQRLDHDDHQIRSLGSGEEVAEPPFVNSFYSAMPAFPGSEHWHQHIELLAHGRQLGHESLHSHVLVAQLQHMQAGGVIPEERTFKVVLRSILAPLGKVMPYDGMDNVPSTPKVQLVLSVLEDMENCGYDPVSSEVLETLFQAFVGLPSHPSQTYKLQTLLSALDASRIKRLLLGSSPNWEAFWRIWRSYPSRFMSRTSEQYTLLFEAIGEGKLRNSLDEARQILRTTLEEMEMEEPAVNVQDDVSLAKAVQKAIEVVVPKVGDANGEREWKVWWEMCRRGGAAADATT